MVQLISIQELSKITGLSESYIYKRTASKPCEIPHYKFGNILRFDMSEISDWLQSKKRKTREDLDAEALAYVRANPIGFGPRRKSKTRKNISTEPLSKH